MSKHTLRDLYLEQLQDIYSAETQLIEALSRMAWKAQNEELKRAFSDHLVETKEQINRLENVFARHPSVKAGGHTCKAMKGLIHEGEEALTEIGNSQVVDAHLIAAAYRVEHYEIAAYKSAISMAKALGESDDAKDLKQNLDEEESASGDLEKMAHGGLFSSGLHKEIVNQ